MSPQGPGSDRGLHGLQHLVHQALLQRSAHRESLSLPGFGGTTAALMPSGVFCCCFLLAEGFRGDRAGAAHSQQVIQPGGDHAGEHGAQIVSFSVCFAHLLFVPSSFCLSAYGTDRPSQRSRQKSGHVMERWS